VATCGGLWGRAAAFKGRLQTPILQVWRLGGLDPGGLGLGGWRLEAWRLVGWLAGLDWTALTAR